MFLCIVAVVVETLLIRFLCTESDKLEIGLIYDDDTEDAMLGRYVESSLLLRLTSCILSKIIDEDDDRESYGECGEVFSSFPEGFCERKIFAMSSSLEVKYRGFLLPAGEAVYCYAVWFVVESQLLSRAVNGYYFNECSSIERLLRSDDEITAE